MLPRHFAKQSSLSLSLSLCAGLGSQAKRPHGNHSAARLLSSMARCEDLELPIHNAHESGMRSTRRMPDRD